MNLSRNCHMNPMSRCEIFFFIPLFSRTLYLLHLLSVSLLFYSFFSQFLFPLRCLTFHSPLIFSPCFSPIATNFCVFDFPLSPDALSLLSVLCIISLPCLAGCPIYKSWTSSPVPNTTYKMGTHCNDPFPAVKLYRSSKLHSRTST